MKEERKILKSTSRRSFFNKGILAGALVLLGIKSTKAAEEDEEKIKLMTADGKLVEVPKKILPKSSGKVVSNKDLLKWVEKNKK